MLAWSKTGNIILACKVEPLEDKYEAQSGSWSVIASFIFSELADSQEVNKCWEDCIQGWVGKLV